MTVNKMSHFMASTIKNKQQFKKQRNHIPKKKAVFLLFDIKSTQIIFEKDILGMSKQT